MDNFSKYTAMLSTPVIMFVLGFGIYYGISSAQDTIAQHKASKEADSKQEDNPNKK